MSRWVQQPTAQSGKDSETEKPNVVIVEDDVALRKLLRLYLGNEFTVSEAGNCDELRSLLGRKVSEPVRPAAITVGPRFEKISQLKED